MTPEQQRKAVWRKCCAKRLEEMQANPYDRSHGTVTDYTYGCRCMWCRLAESEYRKKLYRKHPARMRKQHREYYRKHREKRLEYAREYQRMLRERAC